MIDLLVLSNGAGEDAIAASILRALAQRRPELRVVVGPLIGTGGSYGDGWPRLGVGASLPSQGLANQSWRWWWRDMQSGLLGGLWGQLQRLRQLKPQVKHTLAVGDLMPCILAGLAGLRPLDFVGTAKSVHHHAYSLPERWALKRWVQSCAVRDRPTADTLIQQGVCAHYLGNPMMDDTLPEGHALGLAPGSALLLFPGSRSKAPAELPGLLECWRWLYNTHPVPAAVAVAEGLDPAALARACAPTWDWNPRADSVVLGSLETPGFPKVLLVRRALGDLLKASKLALGLAGTAHEQAAGAGVPVVSPHRGRPGWYRGRQKGLLGEALVLADPDTASVVAALRRLLDDPADWERRSLIGRQRMGQPGGAAAIADWLAQRL